MVDTGLYRSDGVGASSHLDGQAGTAQDRDAVLRRIVQHLRGKGRLWLFLDYDGTLVPIAPRPSEALPDAELLELLRRLIRSPLIRTCVISGRPLDSLKAMLPISGLYFAGLYGVEIQTPGNKIIQRVQVPEHQQTIDRVKQAWQQLIQGRDGFLLEDKGLSVALHSRLATLSDAEYVLPRAEDALAGISPDQYRVLGGDRFLEIAPALAHKGEGVEWLLEHDPLPDALPVYFGDDDKDEEAFGVIQRHGGIPIVVGAREPLTEAVVRLSSPADVRTWLESLV